jgi:hypothetical protein
LPYGLLRASDWAETGCDVVVDSDSQIPWFSGLCLKGEVAAQYRIDRRGGQEGDPPPPYLELDNLAPITIFVGANNSGKSRLLREIFSQLEPVFLKLGGVHHGGGGMDSPEQPLEHLIALASAWGRIDGLGVDIPFEREYETKQGWFPGWSFDALRRISVGLERDPNLGQVQAQADTWLNIYRQFECPASRALAYRGLARYYIPILRGMRPPELAGDSRFETQARLDCFAERTVNDYFPGIVSDETVRREGHAARPDARVGSERLSVFTGLSIYSDLQARLLSSEQELRDSVVEFQKFLASKFFGGQSVVLVPSLVTAGGAPNDVVYIKIGPSRERPIHDLGDGMQSLIICTYPIVTETQRGSLFFLEEPDLCMHPSLQRTFLEVLKAYHDSMGHQFFVTTHSNHLLDLADDPDLVSILSFTAIGNDEEPASVPGSSPLFRIRSASHRDREVLTQLGVRPSSTFLANATIWVEGVSDASYLRAYMEGFVHYFETRGGERWMNDISRLRQYKEDHHYAFVEYNGANLEHFGFGENEDDSSCDQAARSAPVSPGASPTTYVPSLCAEAIVIADGDIAVKGNRWERFREQLGSRLIVLPGKEIENLIPEGLVKRQVEEDHAPGRRGEVARDVIDLIDYAGYSRPLGESATLIGMGSYLGCVLSISKYAGYATLAGGYKSRWSSASEGVPRKIHEALDPASTGECPEASHATPTEQLPMYLTHDLLWLCTCIYLHIAECNHHESVARQLRDFQQHLREWHQLSPAPSSCPSGAEGQEESWPIHNPSDRRCPLTTPPRHANTESASTAYRENPT